MIEFKKIIASEKSTQFLPQTTNGQAGFTLAEMLISFGLAVVVVFGVFLAMRANGTQFETAQQKMVLETSAREGLYKMLQEIRESAPGKISISNDGTSVSFYVPDATTPVTAAYAIDWSGSAEHILYSVGGTNNDQLIRTNLSTDEIKVVANHVTGVTFAGNSASPSAVSVTMNVQKTLTNGRSLPATPLQLTGNAKIRNESSAVSEDGEDDHNDDDDDHDDDDHDDDDHDDDDHGDDHEDDDHD